MKFTLQWSLLFTVSCLNHDAVIGTDICSTTSAAPEIVFPPEEFVITEDQFEMVVFSCSAFGFPPPDISWRRESDGAILQSSSSITIMDAVSAGDYNLTDNGGLVPQVNRSLVFGEVLDEDSGGYTCIANNSAGMAEREFNLSVQGQLTAMSHS